MPCSATSLTDRQTTPGNGGVVDSGAYPRNGDVGPGVGQDVAGHRVQPAQPDAGRGGRPDGGQHVGHDGAGRAHRVQLAGCPQFDHVAAFRSV